MQKSIEKKADEYNIKDIMHNQPICNIGMIGHVSNGKSTIVRQLTGSATQRHSSEIATNKTIKLGYSNAKIFKCDKCRRPMCYKASSSETKTMNCEHCNTKMTLVNHVSLVDNPGHNSLMATMMNGTCVMDYTIIVESLGNKEIPAAQTKEHIKATTLTRTENKMVCINKLDLVKKEEASRRITEFNTYLSSTIAKDSPIIPLAASHGYNIDVLAEYLAHVIPPTRELDMPCRVVIIRSFNVNKPGTKIKDLNGGVVGGSIMEGVVKIGDIVVIKPGFISKNKNYDNKDEKSKRFIYTTLETKVLSIKSEKNKLKYAIPGGLIGIELDVDPSLTSDDGLIGNILIPEANKDEYEVYEDIIVDFEPFDGSVKIEKNMKIVINVNACNSNCTVVKSKKNQLGIQLDTRPICVKIGDYITISSQVKQDSSITILGRGKIIRGNTC